jgi:SAM-dependent methyltransferase
VDGERALQIEWLAEKLRLSPGKRLYDVTCGPGLYAVEFAGRGLMVTGVDFSPAAVAYARQLALDKAVGSRCVFIEQDVREVTWPPGTFEAAIFLYGQLTVFPRSTAFTLLQDIARALAPGGKLCIELLDPDKVDRQPSSWWFTDDTGLWGDRPFIHFGERRWLPEDQISVERFYTIDLATATMQEINLSDQVYHREEMVQLLTDAGFQHVDVYPHWDGLALYDAAEWLVYVATVGS